jgi:hypothetical protein
MPIVCKINTQGKGPVSWSRPIKSFKDKQEFQKLLKEYEENDIIEPSKSSWCNPVVLVRKKSGALRFCVDFRRLNDLVESDSFELPRINELFINLRNMKYFSVIDLKDGFFQIPIAVEDREKTTFFTGNSLKQFKKMPQGYKNSPAIFQRAINLVLDGLIGIVCIAYIDDILIFGKTKSEHDRNFENVIERLKIYKLKINNEKTVVGVETVKFLGYEISLNKLKPTFERSQGIMNFRVPRNKKELQRFLGCINYDRMFVSNLSEKASVLYRLLQK